MSKFRSSILIFGSLILCVAVALATFFALSATGMIVSDPIELTFTVDDIDKTYDGQPLFAEHYELTEGELLKGHTAEVEFTGSQTEVGVGKGYVNVRISDEEGFDVSKTYTVRVNAGMLMVNPRPIEVKQDDVVAEYTGQPIYADSYRVLSGTLLNGHRLVQGEAAVGFVDVCTEESASAQPHIVDATGQDVTANYNMTFTAGSVTITPRRLRLSPVSATKAYDGTPLAPTEYNIIEGSLVEGHVMQVEYATDDKQAATLTDVGELSFTIGRVGIVSADNVDVLDNYQLYFSSSATLTVMPAILSVKLKPIEREYGDELNATVADVAEFSDERVRADDLTLLLPDSTTLDAGVYQYSADWAEDADPVLPKNFRLNIERGSITVTPQAVTIILRTVLGEPQTATAFSESVPAALKEQLQLIYTEGVKAAGTYPYTADWGDEITPAQRKNYTLNITAGFYVIEPTKINVTLNDLEYTYGENIELTLEKAIKTADITLEEQKAVLEIDAPPIKNAGEYSYSVRLKNTPQAGNYVLVSQPAKVTVNRVDLTLTYGEHNAITQVYDGKPVTLETEKFGIGGSDTVYVASASLALDVTNVSMTEGDNPTPAAVETAVSKIVLRDIVTGENVTANYQVAEINISVTVLPKQIMISVGSLTLKSGEDFYDYAQMDEQKYSLVRVDSLVDGHSIDWTTVDLNGYDTVIEIKQEVQILYGNENVTRNYEIRYGYGTITYV